MKRAMMEELERWKASPNRKPLLLHGARQVGKTWLLEEFGRARFENFVRVDFLRERSLREIFRVDFDPGRIVREIALRKNARIDAASTLLILDEVQEAPGALTSLKYFCEDRPEFCVAAAGSYMGVALHGGESFPVGKVDSLTLRPMGFLEFLEACGQGGLADAVRAREFGTIERVMRNLIESQFRNYLFVGGMPEAVRLFAQSGSLEEARRVQQRIVSDYDSDFSKHAPVRLLERMRLVWESLPSQLARENKKFVYGLVRKGARAKDLEESLQWLRDYGAVQKVPRVTALRTPLAGYEDVSAFKVYALDVGLLGALAELPASAVLEGSRLFTEFKGSLVEQYVLQEILLMGLAPYYWSADKASAEVDFAVGLAGIPVPIEVKAAENVRSRSLRVACEKFGIAKGIRTSLSGLRDDGWLTNIPLWAFSQLCAEDVAG